MLKRITYRKKNKEVTERVVYPIQEPCDSMLAIDLTEFSEEERENYQVILEEMSKAFKDAINEVGLSHNYRRFLKEGILEDEQYSSICNTNS